MRRTSNGPKTAGVVLAAGEGRRMRPLTESRPKAGLPVLGRPAIEIVCEKPRN